MGRGEKDRLELGQHGEKNSPQQPTEKKKKTGRGSGRGQWTDW